MYKFYILKNTIWNNNNEILETYSTKNIIRGLKKAIVKKQEYINNYTVNDYTSFSSAYMEYKGKIYSIFNSCTNNKKIQLQYEKSMVI